MINYIRHKIQHNFIAKVSCFIISIFIWLFVMNDINPQTEGTYTVPLTRWHAPENFKITQADESVKIKVRATRSYFIDTSADDFRAYINFDGAVAGEQQLPIVPVPPQGFQVISTSPEYTKVTLEPFETRDIKIDLIASGAAGRGMSLDEMYPETYSVQVTGPKSVVESVAQLIGHVELSGQTNDFTIGVPLLPVDESGKSVPGVTIVPGKVMVDVFLKQGIEKKTVPIQADIDGEPPVGYKLGTVSMNPVRVEISGSRDAVEGVNSISTEEISVAGENSTIKKEVQLILPDGITVENPNVTIEIKIISTSISRFMDHVGNQNGNEGAA